MKKTPIFAVILAGGQSSRLFPFNKVLSDLTGSGRSLIQQAKDRLKFLKSDRIFVLTTESMASAIRKQVKLPKDHFFVDPARRGTWPALLWAMGHLRRRDSDAVMAVLTGDHVIQGDRAFSQSFREAVDLAVREPAIVVLGIPPRPHPEEWRGFGCFQKDSEGRVSQFEEKPSVLRAEEMIRAGQWQWNSGMFFFRIRTAERALERFQPEMYRVYTAMIQSLASGKRDQAALLFQDFCDKIPHPLDPSRYVDNSIDYAIMTPLVAGRYDDLKAMAVTETRFRWTDLGQWDALRQVMKADRRGNICIGKASISRDVSGSILVAEKGRRLVVEGGQNLIVAFSGKTALLLKSDHLSKVKEVAQEALKHADRLVMEHEVSNCDIQAKGGRIVAIGLSGLRIHLEGPRLFVSPKNGFIR